MNISENLIRIKEGKENIIKSLKNKGVSIADNTLINEIPTIIDNAEIGGGDTPSVPTELVQKYEGASVFRIETLKDECEIGFAPFRKNTNYKDFSYVIDWGDGSAIEEIDTDSHIYHIYNTKGVYDINCYNFNNIHYIYTNKEIQCANGVVQYLNAFDNPKNDSYSFSYTNNKEYDYKCTNILVGNNLEIYNISNNPYLETIYIRYIPTSSSLLSVYNRYSNNTKLRIVKSDFDLTINRGYFNNCISLESIITPNGVVLTYENSLFSGCKQLKNITLKISSYKQIPNYTFQNCSSLTSITIPEGITSIEQYAFSGCSSLTSITIPETVTSIGQYAFSGCSSLTSITIPETVTSIANYAFQNCNSLTSINIPETVTSIGQYAFRGCSSLTSITIPETVTSIGQYAFSGCNSLTSINIPETVTSIGQYAFSGCSSLTSITIPETVTSIGQYAFSGCSSLTSITIPETVTSINNYTFQNCSSLTSITIPETVTSIGQYAFSGCKNLQYIEIPNSISTINSSAFYDCYSLQSITCNSNTPPTIQSNSFPTSNLKYTKRYLYVPKDSVGYDEGNWKTYLIDKGWELRYIEDRVKTPTTLKLKTKNNFFHNLQAIGQANLIDYELIDNEYIYHFDDKITELLQYTFYTTALKEIELPEGLEKIGGYIFQNCSSLQSIELPNSVTSIGSSAFSNCSSLTSINIPETVTSIGQYTFSGCSSLQNISIPNSVTSIGSSAFYNCSSLTSINIPETVTSIGQYTFSGCSSLQNISIPNSVTSIGSSAFYNCSSLQNITSLNPTAPTLQYDTFSNIGTSVPSGTPKILRVPEGSDYSTWLSQLNGFTIEYIN